MNPKEITKLLKQCKEAIKNKDYTIALKSCKEVLKIDRNNYMALVFLGAVLQETDKKDQAGNAFLKAIEVSPNEMLAWQGLSSFYEKGGVEENATQLIPVYKQLLRLESDSTKWCEIMSRVEPLLIKTGDAETLASIANDYMWVEDLKKIDALQQVLLNCLSVITIPDHLSTLFGKVLSTAMKRVHFHDWTRYFDQLYRNRLHEIVFITAIELLQINQRAIFLHDWICRIFAETCILKKGYMQEFQHRIPDHVKILLDDYPQNVHAILAQSALYYLTGSYIEARDLLNQCLSINRTLFYGHFLLSEVQFELINYVEALKSAECALSLNTSESKMATKLLIKYLAFSTDKSNWMKAVELSKDFLSSDIDYPLTEYCARAYLKLENWTEFEKSINQLKEDPSFDAITNLLEAKRKAKSESDDTVLLNQLIKLAELYPKNAEIILEAALLYEKEEDYKNAYIYLIKTAKIAPHWFVVYLKLGNCYFRIIKDYDKASRCYQKALQLHPDSDEIGIAMSDTYKMLGDVANHIKLLEMICSSRSAKWAWLRLGLQHLQAGDSTAAVHSLRTALSFDPNQSHLWEALADAYLSRGNHRAALKSYEQAVELRPGAFYPKLQIATIKQVIDQTEESLMDFRELVKNGPSSVLALKGLAETCLCIAKSFWERRLLGLVRDRLQEGISAGARALIERVDLTCLWKIVGDIATLAGQLPKSICSLEIPPVLNPSNQTEITNGINLLKLGGRCYAQALKQLGKKDSSCLVWHDLAYNYRLQYLFTTVTKDKKVLSEKALECAKKSVLLASNIWTHWNLLGVIAALPELKKYDLSQHAFIKALEANDNTPVPWNNLGTLYFMLKHPKLSNLSFRYAQRIDTSFCHSWIGQSLVAESICHEETMDLFRHTTDLGFHPESCMGYGQWVCHTLQSREIKNDPHYTYTIENMHAIPVAIDSLTWATDYEESNACGLNMLGCLFEYCGQHLNAVSALDRALKHASSEHKDIVRNNLARLLVKSNDGESAIEVYKSINKADFNSQCGLALALFQSNRLEESLSTYESALWMATDDSCKLDILVAMAASCYKMGNIDKAKTLLFQCIHKTNPKSVYGLFAACALGMLNNDLVLSRATLKELQPFQDEHDYIAHIANFHAYVKFIQGEAKDSVYSLINTLHRQPWHASLWLNLSLMLLQSHSTSGNKRYAMAAARYAYSAMALGRNSIDVSKILAVVSLSHLYVGDLKQALSASQHAVHLFPAVGESWAVLAASCHSCLEPAQVQRLLSHARQNLDLQRPLAKWMSNFERKVALSA